MVPLQLHQLLLVFAFDVGKQNKEMVVREFAAWGSWSRNRLGIVDKDTRACWALLQAVVKARNAVKDLVFTLCTVVLELC